MQLIARCIESISIFPMCFLSIEHNAQSTIRHCLFIFVHFISFASPSRSILVFDFMSLLPATAITIIKVHVRCIHRSRRRIFLDAISLLRWKNVLRFGAIIASSSQPQSTLSFCLLFWFRMCSRLMHQREIEVQTRNGLSFTCSQSNPRSRSWKSSCMVSIQTHTNRMIFCFHIGFWLLWRNRGELIKIKMSKWASIKRWENE